MSHSNRLKGNSVRHFVKSMYVFYRLYCFRSSWEVPSTATNRSRFTIHKPFIRSHLNSYFFSSSKQKQRNNTPITKASADVCINNRISISELLTFEIEVEITLCHLITCYICYTFDSGTRTKCIVRYLFRYTQKKINENSKIYGKYSIFAFLGSGE